jgi:hypothetical protein
LPENASNGGFFLIILSIGRLQNPDWRWRKMVNEKTERRQKNLLKIKTFSS